MYRGRLRAERLPASLRTPCELIAWTRPESAQDDANLEQYANWFARWLVLCLPWDEDTQEAVLNEVAPGLDLTHEARILRAICLRPLISAAGPTWTCLSWR